MKIEELIEKYESEELERNADKARKYAEVLAEAKKIFEEKARSNLGDLWNELLPKGTEFNTSDNSVEIRFSMDISYENYIGVVRQTFNTNRNTWASMTMSFGYWAGKHLEISFPILPDDIGKFFSRVKRTIAEKAAAEQFSKERDLSNLMDFSHLSEEGVAGRLEEALRRFPEHKNTFEEKAAAQRLIIEKEAEKKLREELAYELHMSEEEQLGLLVDFAWNGPFHIYRIDYGAHIDGDGTEVYTDHLFTLEPKPNASGYFRAFGDGQYLRLIKPQNILATEIITITKAGEAPNELRRFTELKSKVVDDVSILCFLPPLELFAFDYDQVRVVVESMQEKELSDAPQEDNS